MPFLNSQDPSQHGWQKGSAATIVPFAWRGSSGLNSFGGVTFPRGVASGTEGIWTAFLNELAPQIPGGILQGECWGYEDRANVNNPGQESFHGYGLALDVNATHNPNKGGQGTSGSGKYQIGSWATPLAAKYGMLWGGEWDDPMHFELHLSPDEIAAYPNSGAPPSSGDTGQNSSGLGTASLAAAAVGVGLLLIILAVITLT